MYENTEQDNVQAIVEASEAVAEQSYQNAVDAGDKVAGLEDRIAVLEGQLASARHQRDGYIKMYNKVQDFIQASIDRDEWTPEELAEQYWTELAEMLDLNLKLERTITVTATWNLTVRGTQKYIGDCDFDFTIESDGDFEIIDGESYPDVDVTEN